MRTLPAHHLQHSLDCADDVSTDPDSTSSASTATSTLSSGPGTAYVEKLPKKERSMGLMWHL